MGIIKSAEEINDLAAATKDNGGLVFVTAFSGLFAPYWRPDVRGAIYGISQHTTKHHLARATLEASCFQTRAVSPYTLLIVCLEGSFFHVITLCQSLMSHTKSPFFLKT